MNKTDNKNKRSLFRKTAEPTAGHKSSLLASSLSIMVCVLMLVTCSFAWYTAEIKGKGTIQTAKYEVTAVISFDGGSEADDVGSYDGIGTVEQAVTIAQGQRYTVALTAAGGASRGYCIVKVGATEYRTAPIEQGKTLTFTVGFTGSGTTEIVIRSSWGTYQAEQGEAVIADGGWIGDLEEPAEVSAEEQ